MAPASRRSRAARWGVVLGLAGASMWFVRTGDGAPARSGRVGFEVGDELPAFHLQGYTGGWTSLPADDFKDFGVNELARGAAELLLVHVVFPWCSHCAVETNKERALVARAGGKLVVLQVLGSDYYGERPARADLESWLTIRASKLPSGIEPIPLFTKRFARKAAFLLVDLTRRNTVISQGEGPDGFESAKQSIVRRWANVGDEE